MINTQRSLRNTWESKSFQEQLPIIKWGIWSFRGSIMDPKDRDRRTITPHLIRNLLFWFVLTKTIRRWTASTAAQQAKVTTVSGEPSLPWLYFGDTDGSEVKDPGATMCCCWNIQGLPWSPHVLAVAGVAPTRPCLRTPRSPLLALQTRQQSFESDMLNPTPFSVWNCSVCSDISSQLDLPSYKVYFSFDLI